ncbi:MAG TPA: porin family protein [Flavobacteriales bacterium]|nr:porin family protein [Flavobacteriales bacterium]
MEDFYKRTYARLLITVLLAALFYNRLKAQETKPPAHADINQPYYEWEVGFQVMPTYATVTMGNWDGTSVEDDAIIGLSRAGVAAFTLNPTLAVTAEFVYTTFKMEFNHRGSPKRLNVNYISVPLMAAINTSKMSRINVKLVIGPQFGINAGSSVESANGQEPDSLQSLWRVKQGDMGVAYGAGLEFALNSSRSLRLTTGFRGISGFLNVADNSTNMAVFFSRVNKVNVHLYSVYGGLIWLF